MRKSPRKYKGNIGSRKEKKEREMWGNVVPIFEESSKILRAFEFYDLTVWSIRIKCWCVFGGSDLVNRTAIISVVGTRLKPVAIFVAPVVGGGFLNQYAFFGEFCLYGKLCRWPHCQQYKMVLLVNLFERSLVSDGLYKMYLEVLANLQRIQRRKYLVRRSAAYVTTKELAIRKPRVLRKM